MKNTLENKAKFFSLYYGQNIRGWNEDNQGRVAKVGPTYMTKRIISECHLKLEPLKAITDEDKKYLERYLFGELIEFQILETSVFINTFSRRMGQKQRPIMNQQLDYLRSKGYALPFGELSVEQLIEYGWCRLIE